MTYNAYELSNHDGLPISFYEFRWGNSDWFYNSTDRDLDLTINGKTETYKAVAIEDDGITVGGPRPGEVKINLADDLPVVGLYRGTPPSENVRVVVLRKHVDDPETTVFFAGKIDNCKRDGKGSATMLCSIGKQRRGGLRLTWSRNCPHVLYDGQCRVNRDLFAYSGTIAALTGNSFTLAEPPANGDIAALEVGFFDGGIVAWDADGLGTLEQRAIEKGSTETEFLVFGRADGLEIGQLVTLYPGCDRLSSTCKDKFNNLVNYGGITQMPSESPYGINLF